MKMPRLILAAALPAAAALALGIPATSAAGAATRPAEVTVRHTALGSILANRRGFTLYVFTRDARKRDRCISISGCTGIWPLLTTGGSPERGPGVRRALLGTIKLPSGARQVTYAGHPLYTYFADTGPGQTFYVGAPEFGGRWYAIGSAGRIVK